MTAQEFKKVLSTFADNSNDIITDSKELLFNFHGEIIRIELEQCDGELFITENNTREKAYFWIVNRIAKLFMLAERMLEFIPNESNYISPQGNLLNDINETPDELSVDVENCEAEIYKLLDKNNMLSSNVIYLTSDAGEGKTTIINQVARTQAQAYKEGKKSYLILPVYLGGKPFMRFDDIIVASLVNQFRFSGLYYNSFIELVKLGAIVPAFDGFEEMFMESSIGEALSATGQLLKNLDSRGAIVISTRKAYFEFKGMGAQAKLFDTISADSVSFAKLTIKKWAQPQFIAYAKKRGCLDAEKIYNTLLNLLDAKNPILTRAILVKQLIDSFGKEKDFDDLVEKIKAGGSRSYYSEFVKGIVERESFKWIDRSGFPAKPLLSVEQHVKLLSWIAQEMWLNNTEYLSKDVLDFICDIYSETYHLTPSILRQIKERIPQHALISTNTVKAQFGFEHEEFRNYFLGIAIAERIFEGDKASTCSLMRVREMPIQSIKTAADIIRDDEAAIDKALNIIKEVNQNENPISYVKVNLGAIYINIWNGFADKKDSVRGMIFPNDALESVSLSEIEFVNCHFQPTGLISSAIACNFKDCRFERLDFSTERNMSGSIFNNCIVDAIYSASEEYCYYNPKVIRELLQGHNINLLNNDLDADSGVESLKSDDRLILTNRVLRRFVRATQLNENIIMHKVGKMHGIFNSQVLPSLLEARILIPVTYDGGGMQKRYKLGKPMELIEKAFHSSLGNFNEFINYLKQTN